MARRFKKDLRSLSSLKILRRSIPLAITCCKKPEACPPSAALQALAGGHQVWLNGAWQNLKVRSLRVKAKKAEERPKMESHSFMTYAFKTIHIIPEIFLPEWMGSGNCNKILSWTVSSMSTMETFPVKGGRQLFSLTISYYFFGPRNQFPPL